MPLDTDRRAMAWLGEVLCRWHAGMGDPVYAVGSFAISGNVHPQRSVIRAAIVNLSDARNEQCGGRTERSWLRGRLRAMLALTDPKPGAGYCYDLTWSKRSPWTTHDTAWEVAMTGELDGARWLGQRTIDGTLCDVWRATDGTCFAQTAMAVDP